MSKFLTIICLFFNICTADAASTQELMEHGIHIYKFKQCLCNYTGNSVIAKIAAIKTLDKLMWKLLRVDS